MLSQCYLLYSLVDFSLNETNDRDRLKYGCFFFYKFLLEIYFFRHYGSSQFYLTDIMEMRNSIFILSDISLAPQKKSVNQRKKKEWP